MNKVPLFVQLFKYTSISGSETAVSGKLVPTFGENDIAFGLLATNRPMFPTPRGQLNFRCPIRNETAKPSRNEMAEPSRNALKLSITLTLIPVNPNTYVQIIVHMLHKI